MKEVYYKLAECLMQSMQSAWVITLNMLTGTRVGRQRNRLRRRINEEVNGRYVKLAAFIDSGKMDEVVNDMYNKCLLEMQCCTMFDYIRLLDTRIQRMQGSDGAKVIKMNFGMAIMALKAGFPIRRSGWNGKGLMVFKQVPAHIDSDIIPKMQSIPQSAKDLILKGKGFIDYTSQCLIYNENTGRADSWVPSISDVFAEDWEIVE